MGDPILHWQLVTPHPERVAEFYRALFDWTVSTSNALGYRQIETGAGGPNGGIWPAPPNAPSFVQLFVGVSDVESAVSRARDLGASVVIPPTTLPDGDVMAVLTDPCGVSFGVMKRGT